MDDPAATESGSSGGDVDMDHIDHDQVVVLPGMLGFDDFEEEFDDFSEGGDWESEIESVDWEIIHDDFSGGEFSDSGADQDSYQTSDDEANELDMPTFKGPCYLSPLSFTRHHAPSSSNHFQVADAISCDGGRSDAKGQEVIMFHSNCVQIRRVPRCEEQDIDVLFEECINPSNGAVLIDARPFSIARTEDGRYIAIATGTGFVHLIEVGMSSTYSNTDPISRGSSSAPYDSNHQEKPTYVKQKSYTFTTSNQPEMVNSVRFGKVGGKMRLMVGCQDGSVVFFEVPDDSVQLPTVAALCPKREGNASDGAVNEIDSKMILHVATVYDVMCPVETAAIGPFYYPINFATSSADGRWLAACGDCDHVMLLDERNRYQLSTSKVLKYRPGERDFFQYGRGSHYCAFNPSGSILVATSDFLDGAFAWDTQSGDLLFHAMTRRGCYPVSFLDEHVFVFAEKSKRAHVIDVRYSSKDHQVITVPSDTASENENQSPHHMMDETSITGLATQDQKVFLTTNTSLYVFQYLHGLPWSRDCHKLLPDAFKDATRALLLSASSPCNPSLGKLDAGALENIISKAAYPLGEWLPSGPEKQDITKDLAAVELVP